MKKCCVMLVPQIPGRPRGSLLLEAQWPIGRVIKIVFLDGEESLRQRVRAVAEQWLVKTGVNLTFAWLDDAAKAEADIRISFRQKGSWSYLGKFCTSVEDPDEPTMNFGWLTRRSEDLEVQEVVLHEFGHALGLIHEHQNPEAEIPWDRQAVIDYYSGKPNYWSVEKIERNVLQGEKDRVISTPFDEDSIMLYPIDKSMTLNGYETHANSELSASDIKLIKWAYGG